MCLLNQRRIIYAIQLESVTPRNKYKHKTKAMRKVGICQWGKTNSAPQACNQSEMDIKGHWIKRVWISCRKHWMNWIPTHVEINLKVWNMITAMLSTIKTIEAYHGARLKDNHTIHHIGERRFKVRPFLIIIWHNRTFLRKPWRLHHNWQPQNCPRRLNWQPKLIMTQRAPRIFAISSKWYFQSNVSLNSSTCKINGFQIMPN